MVKKDDMKTKKIIADCLTESEAAIIIGCSVAHLRRLRAQGKIRQRYPNFAHSYHCADVEQYGRGLSPKKEASPSR